MKNLRFKKLTQATQQGFTLVEVLVVVGILAILLAITLVALNPTQHFQSARNTQRSSDVTAILDSIYEYQAAHQGSLPPSVSGVTTAVPLGGMTPVSATGTSFSTPNLTFTVPAGNTITSGSVTVSGCSQAGDNGTWPVTSGTGTTIVVTDAGGSVTSATGCSIDSWTGMVDLCADVVPAYIANMPMDPGTSTGTACTVPYDTGYTISKSTGNRFTIAAPGAEGTTVSVTR